MAVSEWPALPYEQWRDTRDTLHMYTQVIGKLRLALSPFEPEWANVPLYVTARGLTTSPIPVERGAIDAELDLIDHVLVLRSNSGAIERRPLGACVADFYRETMSALGRLGVDVAISVLPSEVADPIPFPEDRAHSTYAAAEVSTFFRVLSLVDLVFKQHRAPGQRPSAELSRRRGAIAQVLVSSGGTSAGSGSSAAGASTAGGSGHSASSV